MFTRSIILSGLAAVFGAGLMAASPAMADESISPDAKDFAAMAQCKALQTKYADLAGKPLKIGLGGYTKGWEAPAEDDPSHLEGYDPSVFRRIGACLGMTPEYQNGSFNVLLTSIGSGRVDTGPMLYVTEARMKQVAFLASVQVRDGSVVKAGNPEHIQSMDDLCGKTVAAAAGTYEATKLVPDQTEACKAAGKPAVDMLMVQNTDNSIQAVRSGRADIYLTEFASAKAISETDKSLEQAFTIDLPIMVGLPVAKDKTEIQNALLDAMKVLQSTGVQEKLLDFWGQGAGGARPVELKS